MELNILLIRTIFLLLPGIIGSKLYRKLRGNSQKKWWDDIGEVLLFSLASYVLCSVLRLVDSSEFTAFFDEKVPLSPSAIGFASVAAIVLAFISALFHHRRWINRIAESTGISNRTGDEDIWDFFHNSELI